MKRRDFISNLGCMGAGAFVPASPASIPVVHKNEQNAPGNYTGEDAFMLSVKVIKEGTQFCNPKPLITFSSDYWYFDAATDNHGDFYGENQKEVYFNIRSKGADFQPATVKVHMPGAKAMRVLVGYTDVPFEQKNDMVIFHLVDDRSRGQLMQLSYQSPWGGYPIAFIHNWDIRKAREYALEDFPKIKFAAVHNYLLAAQEVLRQMGNMGPGSPRPFRGDIVLMGSEAAATRGHMDYPPHVHIMHYEFDKEINGEKEWKSRLVPHFYMDSSGNINENKYEVIVGKGERSKIFGVNETVKFSDSDDKPILDLTVGQKGMLLLRLHDGRKYSLQPDPEKGAASAVYGYLNNKKICRAEVKDYPDMGIFRIRLDMLDNDKIIKTLHDGYLYDPFVARKYRALYQE
ncbi:MAG: hypothetical protein KF746_05640 [Chitinophagaceae bacterium]|nr:hypothetical protein [Chitinophagaceae bacterium]